MSLNDDTRKSIEAGSQAWANEQVRKAVSAERERCAKIARLTQGECIGPFETCGCGFDIAARIMSGE